MPALLALLQFVRVHPGFRGGPLAAFYERLTACYAACRRSPSSRRSIAASTSRRAAFLSSAWGMQRTPSLSAAHRMWASGSTGFYQAKTHRLLLLDITAGVR